MARVDLLYPLVKDTLNIRYATDVPPLDEFHHQAWAVAEPVVVDKYWSREQAPSERYFEARLLWSNHALLVRFTYHINEPLIINPVPDLSKKTPGLWERDVCEIFIAPDVQKPARYFEFEVAPTGEWIDLSIEVTPTERITNWHFSSGITSSAQIDNERVMMAIKVPFKSFGAAPNAGDIWLGNVFRCVGEGPDRGYLAWRPTRTETPNFHVPEAFGEFHFTA